MVIFPTKIESVFKDKNSVTVTLHKIFGLSAEQKTILDALIAGQEGVILAIGNTETFEAEAPIAIAEYFYVEPEPE